MGCYGGGGGVAGTLGAGPEDGTGGTDPSPVRPGWRGRLDAEQGAFVPKGEWRGSSVPPRIWCCNRSNSPFPLQQREKPADLLIQGLPLSSPLPGPSGCPSALGPSHLGWAACLCVAPCQAQGVLLHGEQVLAGEDVLCENPYSLAEGLRLHELPRWFQMLPAGERGSDWILGLALGLDRNGGEASRLPPSAWCMCPGCRPSSRRKVSSTSTWQGDASAPRSISPDTQKHKETVFVGVLSLVLQGR